MSCPYTSVDVILIAAMSGVATPALAVAQWSCCAVHSPSHSASEAPQPVLDEVWVIESGMIYANESYDSSMALSNVHELTEARKISEQRMQAAKERARRAEARRAGATAGRRMEPAMSAALRD